MSNEKIVYSKDEFLAVINEMDPLEKILWFEMEKPHNPILQRRDWINKEARDMEKLFRQIRRNKESIIFITPSNSRISQQLGITQESKDFRRSEK